MREDLSLKGEVQVATKKALRAKSTVRTLSAAKVPVKAAVKAKNTLKAVVKKAPVKTAKKVPVVKSAEKAKSPATAPTLKHGALKAESMYTRLLREKAERHEALQRQREGGHQSNEQRMPLNHASYSKFAGPRRRAS